MKNIIIILLTLLISEGLTAQESKLKIALLKYKGGGDWYADPTALPNLARFCNYELNTNLNTEPAIIEPGSVELFNYPLVHLTGHGNVIFSEKEAANIRLYLEAGGFMHIDDNYGMDEFIRREMKKVFPEKDFVELPAKHAIYQQKFKFKNGLPKIHEHDNKRPQGFGLFVEGRLVCYYTFESDISDGWEDPSVHNDPPEVRRKALEMGANIVSFAFGE